MDRVEQIILSARLDFARYQQLKESSYIYKGLKTENANINVKNTNDNQCLKWSFMSALYPVQKDAQRVSKCREDEHRLKFDSGGRLTAFCPTPQAPARCDCTEVSKTVAELGNVTGGDFVLCQVDPSWDFVATGLKFLIYLL